MLKLVSEISLCATLVGVLALLLGYYLAKDRCAKG